jgi:TonB family protein
MSRLTPAAGQPAPSGVVTHSEGAKKGLITSPGLETIQAKPADALRRGSSRHHEAQPAFIANPAPEQHNPDRAFRLPVSVPDHPSDPAPAAYGKLELPPSLLITETKISGSAAATPPALQNTAPAAIAPPSAPPSAPVSPLAVGSPQQLTQVSFVGPQIISRVNPAVPSDVKALIAGETQIDVTVRIDLEGRVTGAQVTSTRGAAARLVAAEAIRAARLFRFQPARENDRAVTSKMVLTFRFKRSGE